MIKRTFIVLTAVIISYGCLNSDKKVTSGTNQTMRIDTISKFEPERYKEEIIDTLIDSIRNLKVIIKKSTRMDKFITQGFELDSLHFQKINYRDRTLEFKVIEDTKVIFHKTITKENLTQINDQEFLSKSIIYGAWFDTYDKEKQEVKMSFNIIVPDTDWGYFYILTVDKFGNSQIEEKIERDEDY
jgi:hypothetical protein